MVNDDDDDCDYDMTRSMMMIIIIEIENEISDPITEREKWPGVMRETEKCL